ERLHTAGTVHNVEWYAAGETVQSDGWRENDGYRLDSALGRINVSLAHRQSLAFLVQYEGGREDDPGSLTAFELAANPRQSPFNLYDFTRGRHRLASLTYSWKPANGWSVSAQGYLRRQDRDTLTTGRFLSGFLARDREHLNGMILQAAKSGKSGPWSWTLSGAVEGNGGKLKARGFYTDFTGGNAVPATDTATTESGEGAYLNLDLGRGKSRFAVGFRRDRHRYTYEDHFNPIGGSQRVFLDNTLRLGYLYKTSRWSSAFVNYSEAYRIPSVVQLFAYPGFYSNPDLVPTRAYDWEAGWRYLKGAWRFSVDAFRMDMRNEVVFVLTQPQFFIGQSENVGRSYRKGVEFTAHMPLVKGLSAFLQGSYMDSVMTAGPNAGSRVPMVPRYQGAGGLQWLVRGLEIRLEGVTVGPERLDNDLANVQPGIPGYTVVNLSARWQYHALTLQASADNLLDRSYVSRGITNGATNYYTPAYPRSYRVSVMWSF
ncbi:MAG: TonB-dependent receptor, partial [Acidobacteriota bacterium]